MILRLAALLLLVTTGCGPSQNSATWESGNPDSVQNENQVAYASEFRLGIAAKEAENRPGHWFVGISTAIPMKEGSVRICLASRSACTDNSAIRYETNHVTRDGREFYFTKDPLALADNLEIAIVGESTSGNLMSEAWKLQPAGSDKDCYKAPDQFICDVEAAIARVTSEYRQRNGRSALVHDQKVSYVSRLWSTQQAASGSISHAWFSNGRLRQEYVKEFGTQPNLSAENVAMNSGASSSAEAVAQRFMNQWINSPGHRANILGNHKKIGVGVAKKGNSWYATQNFAK